MADDRRPSWMEEHIRDYLESNGTRGHIWNGMPTLLLTTQGRSSKSPRMVPLIYGTHEDAYVVIGSKGGHPMHPSWYLNLVANPSVEIQVGPQKMSGTARTSKSPEREQLWESMCEIFSGYIEYATKTSREIPVVVIDPT